MGGGDGSAGGGGGEFCERGDCGGGVGSSEYVCEAGVDYFNFAGDDFDFGIVFVDFECVDGGVGGVAGAGVYGGGIRIGGVVQYCAVDGERGVGDDDERQT